jgi:hypothetical protein
MKGWYKESYRHYLARKGVHTAKRVKRKELIIGGLADNKPDSLFDKKQLAAGIKVEMEHTNNPKLAKEIAKDHLTEDKQYYTHLAEMEKKHQKKYMANSWRILSSKMYRGKSKDAKDEEEMKDAKGEEEMDDKKNTG